MKRHDVIKDNDPRMPNRVLIIERIEGQYVYCCNIHCPSDKTRININRIFKFEYGKPRRSGFTVIQAGM